MRRRKQSMAYGWADRILIVGGGPAGMAAAEELRRQGFSGKITLLCDEPDAPYDRPACSKSLLTGHARPKDVRMPIDGELDVQWKHGRRAVEVDMYRRTVLCQTDEEFAFDGLVIATGSYAELPKGWPSGPGMHILHSVEHAWALRQDLRFAERVAIVGGGLTGCETACAVRELAREAVLIDPKPYVMGRAVGEPIGYLVAEEHRKFGVEMRLGRRVKEVERRRGKWRLSLDDGSYVYSDIVVATLGEKPDVAWLEGTGKDISRGVLCDESLRVVGAEGVVAAGAAVRWPNLIYGSEPTMVGQWIAAVEMGGAAPARRRPRGAAGRHRAPVLVAAERPAHHGRRRLPPGRPHRDDRDAPGPQGRRACRRDGQLLPQRRPGGSDRRQLRAGVHGDHPGDAHRHAGPVPAAAQDAAAAAHVGLAAAPGRGQLTAYVFHAARVGLAHRPPHRRTAAHRARRHPASSPGGRRSVYTPGDAVRHRSVTLRVSCCIRDRQPPTFGPSGADDRAAREHNRWRRRAWGVATNWRRHDVHAADPRGRVRSGGEPQRRDGLERGRDLRGVRPAVDRHPASPHDPARPLRAGVPRLHRGQRHRPAVAPGPPGALLAPRGQLHRRGSARARRHRRAGARRRRPRARDVHRLTRRPGRRWRIKTKVRGYGRRRDGAAGGGDRGGHRRAGHRGGARAARLARHRVRAPADPGGARCRTAGLAQRR